MTLSFRKRFSYGVGHVLNDLCASMWFSYLLLFYHKVLNFSNSTAGYILLAGQIADGIATPLLGYESDRRGNICNYGRRKSWHLIGSLAVAFSFPPLFMQCVGCNNDTPEYAKFIYYVPLVVIFQCGWAATQINHLALIPELARNREEKVNLNAIRYAFTVLSNIMVYVTTWVVFNYSGEAANQLGPGDLPEFRNIVMVVVATGVLFSFLFHIGVKEDSIRQRFPEINGDASSQNSASEDLAPPVVTVPNEKTSLISSTPPAPDDPSVKRLMKWNEWFRRPIFYQMALLYMCTRLVVNLSQVYLPMYLTDTLKLGKMYIAIIPLVVYVSGFFAAVLTKPITKVLRNEVVYMVGSLLVVGACTWTHFLKENDDTSLTSIFFLATILGLGSTVILVMCLSMLSEMVGENTETGAFVYGAMSLTDKISNGVAIAVIQNLNPCLCNCERCAQFFENVLGWLIPAITLIGMMAVCWFSISFRRTQVNSVRLDQDSTGAANN